MMGDLERQLAEAYAECDRLAAEDIAFDRRMQKLRQRTAGSEPQLVYKEREQPQQQIADLQPEVQRRWDAWVDARIDAKIKDAIAEYDEVILDAVGEAISMIRAQWREEISEAVKATKFPKIVGWTPRTHLENEVCVFGGGCYQAVRDTSLPPGSNDWVCIACPGDPGVDGRDADGNRRSVIDLPRWPRGRNDAA